MVITPLIDPYAIYKDGSRDLTADWTISSNSITLTAGILTAAGLTTGGTVKGEKVRAYGEGDHSDHWVGFEVTAAGNRQIETDSSVLNVAPAGTVVGYFSSGLAFACYNDRPFKFGHSGSDYAQFKWATTETNSALLLGLSDAGEASRSFIICDIGDMNSNFAIAAQANPTLFVHSNLTTNEQYIRLTHDTSDGVIGTGVGDLLLSPVGVVKFGTHAAIGAETITGYITIKDAAGNSRKLAVVS